MKLRNRPWHLDNPDYIPVSKIQTYLTKRTGVVLTRRQIGYWIGQGEIKVLHMLRRLGGGRWTRKSWLEEFVQRHRG